MLSRPSVREPELRCPRCGYDQRGVVETWTESCPLRGRCTECGLDFAWWEVFHPEAHEQKWCIEFPPRIRDIPLAATKTFLRALWPFAFWHRLRMSDRIDWRRIVLFLLFLPVPVFLSYALEQTVVALRVRWLVETSVGPAPPDEYIRRLAQGDPRSLQSAQQWSRIGVNHPVEDAVLEAVFFPFRDETTGTVIWPYVGFPTYPYVPPADLHHVLLQEASVSLPSIEFEDVGVLLLGWMIVLLLLPASFALLPVSRRRAKVRWRHIARVGAYSLVVPAATISLAFLLAAGGFIVPWPALATRLLTLAVFVMPIAPGIMLLLWWWAAVSRYLRMPHGFAVALLLMVICVVLAVGIPFAVAGVIIADPF